MNASVYITIALFLMHWLASCQERCYIIKKGYILQYSEHNNALTRVQDFFYFDSLPNLDSTTSQDDLLERKGTLVNYGYYRGHNLDILADQKCVSDINQQFPFKTHELINNKYIKIYRVKMTCYIEKVPLQKYLEMNDQPHTYPAFKFDKQKQKKYNIVFPEQLVSY